MQHKREEVKPNSVNSFALCGYVLCVFIFLIGYLSGLRHAIMLIAAGVFAAKGLYLHLSR